MKKYIYLLLLSPLMFFASCNDDNDFPSVDLTVKMDGATDVGDVLYIVQGEPFSIDEIEVSALNGKAASLTAVGYYWDGVLSQVAPIAPYTITWNTSSLAPGKHLLQLQSSMLESDKTITSATVSLRVMVVPTASDLPEGNTLGEVTEVISISPS